MSAAPECTVTFPIENGMFGVDSLAKRLNVLVSDGQIGDWQDAIPKTGRNLKEANASEWRAPE